MAREQAADVTYRVWCDHTECDFERAGDARTPRLAQKRATGHLVGHALDTGHHETYRAIHTPHDHNSEDSNDT